MRANAVKILEYAEDPFDIELGKDFLDTTRKDKP